MPRTKNEIAAELDRIQKEFTRLQGEFKKIAKDAFEARKKGLGVRDASAIAKLRKSMGLQ
jgi:hypothetical protein